MLNSLFHQILNLSIDSSYIIICVIIARFFLKKAPKIYSFALWSVVFFRLICPYTFETQFSFFEKSEITPVDISTTVQSTQPTTTDTVTIDFEDIYNQTLILPYTNSPTSIFAVIWCVGVLAFLIISTISYVNLKKKLSTFLHFEKNIYLVDFIETPFVLGLIHPKIYLPSNLTENEKHYIISHEECHIKRFDHISRFLAFCILILHWFNPLVWIAFVLSGRDMELSIDEKVIKHHFNTNSIKEYATLLLSVGTKTKTASPLYITPTFGNGDIKERVSNIMNFKKTPLILGCVLTILVIILAIIFSTSKLTAQYDTEFAGFVIESYLDYSYKDIYSDELKEAQDKGIISIYQNPNNSNFVFDTLFLAHGLLPKSEHINIDPNDSIAYMSALNSLFDKLNLSEEVFALGGKLIALYRNDISYTIQNSTEDYTSSISSEEIFYYEGSRKSFPVTYGTVTLSIKPIDVLQGIDKSQFDLLWEELSITYDDKTELQNAYLVLVLNTLIDNYTATTYKDAVIHDVNVSALTLSQYAHYTMHYRYNDVYLDITAILANILFDYMDKY